jgi:hypothetical protein
MDYSQIILSYMKDETIKKSLNPVNYYALKSLYNPEFTKRSRFLSEAIRKFFEALGNTLEIDLFDESVIEKENNGNRTNLGDTICIDLGYNTEKINDNLNITVNKDNFMNMTNLFSKNWDWSINLLFDTDEEYILDKDDDYILLKLIKNYLFSDEDPKTSQLLISYNIFATSIELIYCLKLAEKFPKTIFNPRETSKFNEYTDFIRNRIQSFYNIWGKMYANKLKKNNLIRELIGNRVSNTNEEGYVLDLISLSMVEPLLNSKYVSFTKLIREGPFCFEIEEVARQICIIDHEYLSSLHIEDYNKFVIKREIPESFNKFAVREKQLKCYILLFILMHNNLENKKNMIQNFISLAHTCKLLQNQQTSYTIISAFNIVGITKKNLLWKLIEKKYREMFSSLEKEFNDIELNEETYFSSKNISFPSVPHVNRIKGTINNFIIKLKDKDIETKNRLSRDYKEFNIITGELCKNKYSFFKVNPLYDFFKFGFLEIFKPKKWNLKLRIDFSNFTDDTNQLDQLLDFLITNFKKLHN